MADSQNMLLEDADYVRQRLEPCVTDGLYLHLADLRLALVPAATSEALRVLDFGCGGSPYRSLFPQATYRRADFQGNGIDYVISPESRIEERGGLFDLVLSTQVLEHCASPQQYLAECLRLLRPGGRLVCTTHGTFEDHACPYDFRRWTADGLRLELESAGFSVESLRKVTCGPRVVLFLMQQVLPNLRKERGNWYSRAWRVVGHALGWFRGAINRASDRCWPQYRVMETTASEPGSNLYVAILAHATKPLPGDAVRGGP